MPPLRHSAGCCRPARPAAAPARSQAWPKIEDTLIKKDHFDVVIQINGKKRAIINAINDEKEETNNSILIKTNILIKEITECIEKFHINVAVAKLYIFLNNLNEEIDKKNLFIISDDIKHFIFYKYFFNYIFFF